MKNKLEGRRLFAESWSAFFEIKAVEPPMESCEDMGEMLRLINLHDGSEALAHWVSEIGEHFVLVPDDYPNDKIKTYHEALASRNAAETVLMGVELEIAELLNPI